MKVGETTLLSLHDDEIKGVYIPAANSFLPSALADASELVFSLRGIGWNFGTRIYVPPMPEYTRNSFILHTFLHGLNNFLLFDLTLTLIINIPGLGSVDGGSMFFENLPPVQRYFVSSVIMLLVAVQFVAGFAVTDSMTALVGVGILQQDPKEWPPIMEAPWAADSLHDFWGRRWHQTLRHIFFVYGGMPGQLIAGKAGMVIGSFFASALYHELGMYLIDRPFDYRAVLFFLLNGVGVVFEWVFYKLSGRRVSGIIGRIWAWVFVLGFGQMLIDSWFVRGLGGSQVLPLESSPTRMFLAPILEPFLASDYFPIYFTTEFSMAVLKFPTTIRRKPLYSNKEDRDTTVAI
ncbi:hypothetical protein EUX98_g5281 [Antrodiella citrinella]|uniref:Wax synthase domain-containing protein n=1 Tax=Antrodiella citrinella TaxID=2447956 RepID=A0A4S4MRY0_9APHY|nr:hypothetical protein EUX98_g5281 [Antrodiella citrinella]